MVDVTIHAEEPRRSPKPNGKAHASKKAKTHVEPVFGPANPREARRCAAWLKDRLNRARLLSKGSLIHEVADVTPELAELILTSHNAGNRSIRKNRVERYAATMKDGRWLTTGQGISFSREGLLNNGQHRLLAIIQSGCTVTMTVTFGEDRDAFKVVDTGAIRSPGDALKIDGHKYTTALGAAARTVMMIDSGLPLQSSRQSYDNDLITEYVNHHPALEAITPDGHRIATKLKTSSAATVAAVYMIDRDSSHRPQLAEFIDKLVAGTNLSAKSPILALRDGLIKKAYDTGRNGKRDSILVTAAIINAWNLWIRKKSTSTGRLAWDPKTTFPPVE